MGQKLHLSLTYDDDKALRREFGSNAEELKNYSEKNFLMSFSIIS
jgi:hypothetical protein